MEQEVVHYIQEARKHGLTDMEIKQNLLNTGWDAAKVEEAFAHAKAQTNQLSHNADEDITMSSHAPKLQPSLHAGEQALSFKPAQQPQNAGPLSSAAPTVSASQPLQPAAGKRSWRGLWISLSAVVTLVALGAGAYAYYTYVYNSPEKVWQAFSKAPSSEIYKNTFKLSFEDTVDPNTLTGQDFVMSNINLSFDGKFYVDGSDKSNPKSSSDVQYTFGSGNTNISTGFKYRLINKVLYVNVGENPFLDSLIQNLNNGKKLEWVKVDMNELEQKSKDSASSTEVSNFDKVFNAKLQDEIAQLWKNTQFVTMESALGREKIGDIQTIHFKNSLDKQAVKNLVHTVIKKVADSSRENGQELKPEDEQLLQDVLAAIVDKIEIKQFETWIGVQDKKLHKVKIVSNAPSIISAIYLSTNMSTQASRDSKRLADIRQVAAALELYFNDHNGYPPGNQGIPLELTPLYLGVNPTAPVPADGGCTNYFNTYWYEPTGEKTVTDGKTTYSSYQMTFCLGGNTGGYAAGIAKLTPQGISGNIACPSTPENCGTAGMAQDSSLSTTEKDRQEAMEFLNNWNFSAKLNIEAEYSDYGKQQTLDIPEEAVDLLDLLKSQQVLGAFTAVESLIP